MEVDEAAAKHKAKLKPKGVKRGADAVASGSGTTAKRAKVAPVVVEIPALSVSLPGSAYADSEILIHLPTQPSQKESFRASSTSRAASTTTAGSPSAADGTTPGATSVTSVSEKEA